MVKFKVITSNKNNYGYMRTTKDIEYIVIHYTANDGDRATSNGNYFKQNRVGASAHFFVDDNTIVQSVPINFVAWSVGGNKYKNTKGAKFYGKCTNNNSISIELCDTIKDGKFGFTEKTVENAIMLTKKLMNLYNIPISNVIRHYDVTGKLCPAPFVNENKWCDFKNKLKDNDMNEKRYNNLNEIPNWAREVIKELINQGKFADPNHLDLSLDMIRILTILKR